MTVLRFPAKVWESYPPDFPSAIQNLTFCLKSSRWKSFCQKVASFIVMLISQAGFLFLQFKWLSFTGTRRSECFFWCSWSWLFKIGCVWPATLVTIAYIWYRQFSEGFIFIFWSWLISLYHRRTVGRTPLRLTTFGIFSQSTLPFYRTKNYAFSWECDTNCACDRASNIMYQRTQFNCKIISLL